MTSNTIIRLIKKDDIHYLEDLLYVAVYQPDAEHPVSRDILDVPEIRAYIKDFGKLKDDHCFVADCDGKIAGAVWVRIFPEDMKGYGYVDGETPELAIAMFEEYRRMGIGTELMNVMISYLQDIAYKRVSLSVQCENPAFRLYVRLGFKIVHKVDDEFVMVLTL